MPELSLDAAARLRVEYESAGIDEADLAPDPFTQFSEWFQGALDAGVDEPTAFVLATVGSDGRPSARAVLMKSFDESGIGFHTGLGSRKSREIEANPYGAATFVWLPLHRQVRFEGRLTRISDEAADRYFATRPRGARIAAHASKQSQAVSSREELEERFRQLDASFGEDVPRPEDWGGWKLEPDTVEFWQGRPNRFHDRLRYRLVEGVWIVERLAP